MVVVDDVDAAVVASMKKASDKTICIFVSTFDDCTCTTPTYKFLTKSFWTRRYMWFTIFIQTHLLVVWVQHRALLQQQWSRQLLQLLPLPTKLSSLWTFCNTNNQITMHQTNKSYYFVLLGTSYTSLIVSCRGRVAGKDWWPYERISFYSDRPWCWKITGSTLTFIYDCCLLELMLATSCRRTLVGDVSWGRRCWSRSGSMTDVP